MRPCVQKQGRVMRDMQDMSVEETADFLVLPPATVKSRLHRARRQLRRILDDQLDSTRNEAFPSTAIGAKKLPTRC